MRENTDKALSDLDDRLRADGHDADPSCRARAWLFIVLGLAAFWGGLIYWLL